MKELQNPACDRPSSIVLPNNHTLNEDEFTSILLEAQTGELGARIAGLEGIVFAMRQRQMEFAGQISNLIEALSGATESGVAAAVTRS